MKNPLGRALRCWSAVEERTGMTAHDNDGRYAFPTPAEAKALADSIPGCVVQERRVSEHSIDGWQARGFELAPPVEATDDEEPLEPMDPPMAALSTAMTDEQIEAFMTQAAEGRDDILVAICLVALGRSDDARVAEHHTWLAGMGMVDRTDSRDRARAECAFRAGIGGEARRQVLAARLRDTLLRAGKP